MSFLFIFLISCTKQRIEVGDTVYVEFEAEIKREDVNLLETEEIVEIIKSKKKDKTGIVFRFWSEGNHSIYINEEIIAEFVVFSRLENMTEEEIKKNAQSILEKKNNNKKVLKFVLIIIFILIILFIISKIKNRHLKLFMKSIERIKKTKDNKNKIFLLSVALEKYFENKFKKKKYTEKIMIFIKKLQKIKYGSKQISDEKIEKIIKESVEIVEKLHKRSIK